MFPTRLKYLRNKKGLSQQNMGDFLGITRQGYGKYEDSKSQPDHETLIKLAKFFEVTTDYLLGKSDDPQSSSPENEYDSLYEINQLLKKYNIDQSGFFDIEKWKNMGPEEIKQLESYFEFIVQEAEKKNKQQD